MNDARIIYSSCAAALALVLAGVGSAAPLALPPPKPGADYAPATKAAIAHAEAPAPYPSLTSIPAIPKDVRSIPDWKKAVLALKADGAHVTALTEAGPWTLHNTEAWAAGERAEAAPPAPTKPAQLGTAAFVAAMIARATPPPPLHHPTTAGAHPTSQHP